MALVAQVASAPGQTFLVALINAPVAEALELSATELSSGYLVATLASASLQVVLGRLSDAWGPRSLIAVASLGLAASCVGLGWASNWAGLSLVFFGLRFFGQGALSLGSGHLLARLFTRNLGTMEGVRLAAMGLAVATLPTLLAQGIQRWGYAVAYAVAGAVVAAAVAPLWLLVRILQPQPWLSQASAGAGSRWRELGAVSRDARYWVLLAAATLQPAAGTAILFHLEALSRGVGERPARLLVLLGVLSTVSTLGSGRWVDRAPGMLPLRASCGFLVVSLALLIWANAPGGSVAGLWAALAALALAGSLHGTSLGPLLARAFGPAHHGLLRSSLSTAAVAGTSLGPLLLGMSLDRTQAPTLGLGAFAIAATALAVATRAWPNSAR